MQIMAEIKIRTEEILLQCRYAGVISLSGHTYNQQRGGGQGSDCVYQTAIRNYGQSRVFWCLQSAKKSQFWPIWCLKGLTLPPPSLRSENLPEIDMNIIT